MANVYNRTCVKAWEITALNGDHFEVVPGTVYTTSQTWPEGDCTVFTRFWARVPAECFSAPRPPSQKLGDGEGECASWMCGITHKVMRMPQEPNSENSPAAPGHVASTVGLGVTNSRPLPRGEVMARGIINGLPVEVTRYTEDDIRTRDRQWEYDLQRERDAATQERCRFMNLECDLRRLLRGEATLNSFDVVEELMQRLDA